MNQNMNNQNMMNQPIRFRRDWQNLNTVTSPTTAAIPAAIAILAPRPATTLPQSIVAVVADRTDAPSMAPSVDLGLERPINRAADAPLASIIDSKLQYGLYANQGSNANIHLIPDFSYAGYMGGGVALPTYDSISVQRTLTPSSGGDDTAILQQALDEVGSLPVDARGIKGAVLLTRGTYTISQPLRITSSGVIL